MVCGFRPNGNGSRPSERDDQHAVMAGAVLYVASGAVCHGSVGRLTREGAWRRAARLIKEGPLAVAYESVANQPARYRLADDLAKEVRTFAGDEPGGGADTC
jgi:mono/diheme cytochrome c family protein